MKGETYWLVPGRSYWVVGDQPDCWFHNLDAATDMGDLPPEMFRTRFPHAVRIEEGSDLWQRVQKTYG